MIDTQTVAPARASLKRCVATDCLFFTELRNSGSRFDSRSLFRSSLMSSCGSAVRRRLHLLCFKPVNRQAARGGCNRADRVRLIAGKPHAAIRSGQSDASRAYQYHEYQMLFVMFDLIIDLKLYKCIFILKPRFTILSNSTSSSLTAVLLMFNE